MLTQDITLVGDAASSRTYAWLGATAIDQANASSLRSNPLTGTALPETLAIKHSTSKKGTRITDRHLVRLDLTKAHALTGELVGGAVYLVIEAPRDTITSVMLKDMVTQLKNLLDAGRVQQILNGES